MCKGKFVPSHDVKGNFFLCSLSRGPVYFGSAVGKLYFHLHWLHSVLTIFSTLGDVILVDSTLQGNQEASSLH